MSLIDDATYIEDGLRIYGTQYPETQRVLRRLHVGKTSAYAVEWGRVRRPSEDWHDPGDDYACIATRDGELIGEVFGYQLERLGYSIGSKVVIQVYGPGKDAMSSYDDRYSARILPTSAVIQAARRHMAIAFTTRMPLVQYGRSLENIRDTFPEGVITTCRGRLVLEGDGRRYDCLVDGACVGRTAPSAQQDIEFSFGVRFGEVPRAVDVDVKVDTTGERPRASFLMEPDEAPAGRRPTGTKPVGARPDTPEPEHADEGPARRKSLIDRLLGL